MEKLTNYQLPEEKEMFDFLNKASLQLPQQVEILDIFETTNEFRPLFLGKFSFGKKKFDLPIEMMKGIVKQYGSDPQSWIGKKMILKSNPYVNKNKKKGLTLSIEKFI